MLLQESFFVVYRSFLPRNGRRKNSAQEMMRKSGIAVWLFDVAMWLLELHYDWKFLLCMFELRL